MALEIGSRLGHYEVTALIGEGGMGQVYQATDTKLNRQVALKILPEAFSTDPDRLARFQREAQVLASLNHPGIAAIYGLEEKDETRALVLALHAGRFGRGRPSIEYTSTEDTRIRNASC
jgi:serine/threonine-protein kinase